MAVRWIFHEAIVPGPHGEFPYAVTLIDHAFHASNFVYESAQMDLFSRPLPGEVMAAQDTG